jgi:hypothetical protein
VGAGSGASVIVGVRTACTLADGAVLVNAASAASQVRDPNTADNQASVSTTVSNPPPGVTGLGADRSVLWPPNHRMVDVALSYQVSDNCDPNPVCQVAVASDEPVQGSGDGNTAPDWEIVDARHVRLRAERAGGGDGRTYTLTVTCRDSAGGASSASTIVSVPLSQR